MLGAAIDKEKGGELGLLFKFLIPKAVNGQQQGGGASGTVLREFGEIGHLEKI